MVKDGFLKKAFLVFFLFLIIIFVMQFRVKEIIGFDGWLHIKVADIMRKEGIIMEFPYTTESILRGNYADLQLLFRVLLIPFTYLGLVNGAKMASVFFASLCFAFFYWYLKKNKVKFPLFWTSLYAISSVDLMYRFLLPRAMPLAISSLVLSLYFIDKRMYKSLFLTSLLFTWLYQGFVFQLLVILIYAGIGLAIYKKMDIKLVIYPMLGVMLAIIANPYFPANIEMLYTQIVKVNLQNVYNAEWQPWNIREFLSYNYLLLTVLITGLSVTVKRMKLERRKVLFLVLSAGFLLAMIKTRRMHEYFAPFTILFGAFSLNDIPVKKTGRYIGAGLIIVVAVFNLIKLDTHIKNNHFLPWYKGGAEWLKENAAAGSTVFINGYTFNYLFFHNPGLVYTHGIDLTYSYLYDAEKFERYMAALQGKDTGYNIIKEDYNADYAVVGKIKQDIRLFEYVVRYKEDFELLYEDESVGILRIKK